MNNAIEVNEYIKSMTGEMNRTECIEVFCKKFNTTKATAYQWIKGGKHFVVEGKNIVKLIK